MPGKPDDSYMPDGLETPTTGGSVANVEGLAKSILERSGAQIVWESKSRDVLRVRYSEADDNACFTLSHSLSLPFSTNFQASRKPPPIPTRDILILFRRFVTTIMGYIDDLACYVRCTPAGTVTLMQSQSRIGMIQFRFRLWSGAL
jgi:hypothetical protein